ncbi:terminase gpA endonuclease subunit [uncultured Devosia sp.]|uniref:terminase gpA endonuclease subunit n=1 Tax=uncultured Devosia sp. TaxID=211434 RepID=UPI002605A02D|nr:terminase gpA endonuclease subunit [uncultured Devosia sp.]
MTSDLHAASDARIRNNGKGIFHAAALGLMPDPQELVSVWAEEFRVVPDMGAIPGRWHNDVAPELVEIMDCLSPDHPCEQVVLMKPSQSGGSAVAENWIGYIMHRTPAPTMYVGPTVSAAQDWYQEKLGPTISATDVLAPEKGGVVAPNKSRSGEGSTGKRLRFRGGFLLFAGANSAATLRQHSIRFMVRDDRSAWTDNADNEGDPKDLSDARLKTYRVFGLAKVFDVSSPKFEDEDIDAEYKRGDQRHYYLACLGCGALVDLAIEDLEHNPVPPYRAHYTCPLCQREHFNVDKRDMKARENGACWIPTAADADGVMPPKVIPKSEIDIWRHREVGPQTVVSFRMVGEANTFETWDNLIARKLGAGDDPVKLQPFQNSDLGRPYRPKTDVPSWEALAARREPDWHRGTAPAGVLYVTLTADVQGDGIYYAYKGWGPNKQVWHLDYGFLPGTTDAPLEGAWPKLDLIADRGIRFGSVRVAPDMIAVDSGYNALAVYAWVKRRHNALAIKGEDGWSKQPIYRSKTTETKTAGPKTGQAKKFGLRVWLVGTWGIKGALMVYLGRVPEEGKTGLPSGYQHYPADAEQEYFEQLTSEYVATETVNGEKRRTWKTRGPNHWLDCAVYGWALTHYVGLWNWTEERWQQRARELAEMLAQPATDLFEQNPVAAPAVVPVVGEEESTPPQPAAVQVKPKRDDGLDALKALNR